MGDTAFEAIMAGLKIERDRMVAMLRRLEWMFVERAGAAVCPCCQHAEDVGYGGGHAPGCELDALLNEVGRG